MTRRIFFSILLFCASATAFAQSDASFMETVLLQLDGTQTGRVGIADVAGSSLPDIVVTSLSGKVRIFGNEGLDVVPTITDIATSTEAAQNLVIVDIDNDGDRDIVVSFPTHTEILRKNGATWSSSSLAYGGNASQYRRDLHVVDIDDDGDLDIARDNQLWLGDGFGGFPTSTTIDVTPTSLLDRRYADFDGDGDADVAELTVAPLGTFAILKVRSNLGSYTLGAPVELGAAVATAGYLRAADFTGDGRIDLLISGAPVQNFGSLGGVVQVFEGLVGGGFRPKAAFYPSAPMGTGDIVVDIEGDGDLDVLGPGAEISIPGSTVLRVHRNRGDGTFENGGASAFVGGLRAEAGGAAADLDGDGDADVVCPTKNTAGGIAPMVYLTSLSPAAAPGPELNIEIVSGDGQVAPPAASFSQPLVVRVTDDFGAPVMGAPVTFYESTIGAHVLIQSFPMSIVTGIDGTASTPVLATANQGDVEVTAFATFGRTVTFSLDVGIAQTLAKISGDQQASDGDEAFHDPLVVRLVDHEGAPIRGYPVTFTLEPATAAIIQGSPVVMSDANGMASVALTGGTTSGAFEVNVTAGIGATTFNLFSRRLTVGGSTAFRFVAVNYFHEHANQPVILAIDAPQASPVATPFGLIQTSILAPQPSLIVLDPSGAFGIPDPALVANPNLVRVYNYPPSFSGLSIVVQIYGFDPFYHPDLTRAIFVSNAVNRTL